MAPCPIHGDLDIAIGHLQHVADRAAGRYAGRRWRSTGRAAFPEASTHSVAPVGRWAADVATMSETGAEVVGGGVGGERESARNQPEWSTPKDHDHEVEDCSALVHLWTTVPQRDPVPASG